MPILVVGGAGYIGSQTAKRAAAAGLEPVVLDNLVYGHRWAVKWGPFVEGDLADQALVRRVLEEHHIDAVVHFAAYAYVGESVTNPRKYFRNNLVNTLNLLDAMLDAGVRDIVFSSTCAVYGEPVRIPIAEDHPRNPVSPYGESKLAVEKALHWYQRAYGLRTAALRYFNAAGADPEGEVGEEHDPETHLIPLALEAALGGRELQIFGTDYPTPDGTAIRDYIHVADLADAHLAALETTARGARQPRRQPGHGAGSLGAGGRGGGRARDGPEGARSRGRPTRRQSARPGGGRTPGGRGPRLDAEAPRSRHHRGARVPLAGAGSEAGVSALWEERWHPLREEWVIVAAHRQHRPWTGETVAAPAAARVAHDPGCYLCPGNARVSGAVNPRYDSTFVFDNDHPCVGPDAPRDLPDPPPPYRVQPAVGLARVVCFSPRHDLTLAEMPLAAIGEVVEVWRRQTRDLGGRPEVNQVLCFENKGEIVGVSNPHPHGQIYATGFVWKTMETELSASRRHHGETGRGLFDDVIRAEQADGRRILYEDDRVIAFVPYFARYAYEVYVAPKRRVPHVHALDDGEAAALAGALKDVTARFDGLWRMSFPYVMVLHQAPTDGGEHPNFHFFIAFHPPLRQPRLLKYLAGPEIGGGNFLSDTSPEATAAELRGALAPART